MSQDRSEQAETREAPAARSHAGSCHCGAVRFTAHLDLAQTIACNCSICATKGLILAFTPAASFSLESGEDRLKEYRFNQHVIRHLFCTDCGVQPFSRADAPDGTPMVAINVRTLEGVDPGQLAPAFFDGRSA